MYQFGWSWPNFFKVTAVLLFERSNWQLNSWWTSYPVNLTLSVHHIMSGTFRYCEFQMKLYVVLKFCSFYILKGWCPTGRWIDFYGECCVYLPFLFNLSGKKLHCWHYFKMHVISCVWVCACTQVSANIFIQWYPAHYVGKMLQGTFWKIFSKSYVCKEGN